MAFHTWTVDSFGHYGLLEALEKQLMERFGLVQIQIAPDPRGLGVMVTVETKDYGIWEWNDEIIEDKTDEAVLAREVVSPTDGA